MEQTLLDAFNKQINRLFSSSYQYFAMSTYFDEIMMEGFSKYMRHKASEELSRAQEIYDYLILRDEKLSFLKIDEPSADWVDVSDIFSAVLSHEENMLNCTLKLYSKAKETADFGALEFISKMIDFRTRTVSQNRKLVFRIRSSTAFCGLERLDTILSK